MKKTTRFETFRWRALLVTLAWVATLACAESGRAEDPDAPRDRVSFKVERSREVANDRVRAVVGVSDEDTDSAALADRVNREMAWALELGKGTQGATVRSGGYHTSPVYEQGKLRRWRASQELILEGSDAGVISELVGRLQSRLQLRGFTFEISPERRRQVEDELIGEALTAYRARAEIVRKGLGASGYGIGSLSIDTGGVTPMPRHAVMRAEAAAVAPPAVEPGSSRVTVFVRGSIVLE